MRRPVTRLFLLAVVAAAMMGAEDPGCDRAKGRTPHSAEHDPKPLVPESQKPKKKYTFRVTFDTTPHVHTAYEWHIGKHTNNGRFYLDKKFETRDREDGTVYPGEKVKVTASVPSKTILECFILYVPDPSKPRMTRVRSHYIDDKYPYQCDLKWTVTDHEENIPSLG